MCSQCVCGQCEKFSKPLHSRLFHDCQDPNRKLESTTRRASCLTTTALAHYDPSHRLPISSQLSEIKGCFPTALPHFIVWNVGILGIEENNRGGKAAIWISLNCFKNSIALALNFHVQYFLSDKNDIMLCVLCNFRDRLQHFIPNVFFTLYGWMGICFVFPSTAERKRSFWIQ